MKHTPIITILALLVVVSISPFVYAENTRSEHPNNTDPIRPMPPARANAAGVRAPRDLDNNMSPHFGGGQSPGTRVRNVSNDTRLIEHRAKLAAARNQTHLRVSNGRNASVKIMPETASERAIERLRLHVCSQENNCSIRLKEVGSGNQTRAAYEVQAEKQAKLFGFLKTRMRVHAEVDAENGEVIRVKKPWWAFLATE